MWKNNDLTGESPTLQQEISSFHLSTLQKNTFCCHATKISHDRGIRCVTLEYKLKMELVQTFRKRYISFIRLVCSCMAINLMTSSIQNSTSFAKMIKVRCNNTILSWDCNTYMWMVNISLRLKWISVTAMRSLWAYGANMTWMVTIPDLWHKSLQIYCESLPILNNDKKVPSTNSSNVHMHLKNISAVLISK